MIDWCCGPWYTGDPASKITSWYTRDPASRRTWFLLDFAIHMIDLARFMFGEVEEVYARRLEERSYAVTLAFANGAVGSLGFSQDRGRSDGFLLTERVDLVGTSGQSICVSDAGHMMRYSGRDVVDWHGTPFAVTDSLVETGYVGELAEFVSAVREQREPEASIANSYQTMLLYEAIERSASECQAVRLSEQVLTSATPVAGS
jgi:predicted dehydrogenase